jgi:hypothetical protein
MTEPQMLILTHVHPGVLPIAKYASQIMTSHE